jgi:hypothetical protein
LIYKNKKRGEVVLVIDNSLYNSENIININNPEEKTNLTIDNLKTRLDNFNTTIASSIAAGKGKPIEIKDVELKLKEKF